MEVDEFTEQMMERAKARKEYLSKKLHEIRKRRTVLGESQLPELHDSPAEVEEDDSPKRQRLSKIESPKEHACQVQVEYEEDSEMEDEDKENGPVATESSPFVPYMASETKGLAALRRNRDTASSQAEGKEENGQSERLLDEKVIPHCDSSQTCRQGSRLSRLAALAADIRHWEEDSYSASKMTNQAYSLSSSSKTTNSLTSNIRPPSTNSAANASPAPVRKPSKRVSFHPSCTAVTDSDTDTDAKVASGGGNYRDCDNADPDESFGYETVKQRLSSKLGGLKGNEQQVRKVQVWDQAILTTLESQGYVKSQSSSKLSYNFEKSPSKGENQNKQGKADAYLSRKEDDATTNKAENKAQFPIKEVCNRGKPQANCPDQSSGNNEDHNTSAVDPAELPLSKRKALFEKAFCQDSSKQGGAVIEPNLSVAQRAAIFEQAAKAPAKREAQKFLQEPRKFSVPASPLKSSPAGAAELRSPAKSGLSANSEKIKSVSPGKLKPQSPVAEAVLSPSKNVGAHTRLVQQQLIEHSSNDWKKKETVAKASEQRKSEISTLLSHWEKVSSASYENVHKEGHNATQRSTHSEGEMYPVFEEEEQAEEDDDNNDCADENDEDDSEAEEGEVPVQEEEEEEECEASEEEEEEEEGPEGEEPYENVASNSFEFRKSTDLPNDEVAAEDIIDEVMDKALGEELARCPPPPDPPVLSDSRYSRTSNKTSSSVSSTGSFGSYCSQQDDRYRSGSAELEYSDSPVSNDGDTDVPLMHTVSFYRRQKNEKRATPIRTIVRREAVSSPPSPEGEEEDRTKEIQGRIQALQEEILAQQTVISQTSQALNLCLATEEFSGSTEQVECERLLLISTHRRQACLNEMQRLKSLITSGKRLADGTGTLIINDIKLPLKQDFIMSHRDGKSNDNVHYFLCLIRHGHQVVVTQMMSAEDAVKQGSLCFTNHITLHELPPDFSVAFEVYTLKTKKEVLPHARKYHIKKEHSKLRLTPKSRKGDSKLLSPAVTSPGGPNAVRTPNFSVVGFTRFTLQNCNRQICTLEKVPFASPLEGVLQLKMHLHAEHRITERGFLTMFEDISGFGAWHRRWCLLNGKTVAFWKYPDDEKKKEPMLVIYLKQCVTGQVKLVSRDVCARPHTFELVTVRPQAKGDKNTLISRSANTVTTTKYLLSADTKEERILWCNRLNDALTNIRKWDPEALRPVEARADK